MDGQGVFVREQGKIVARPTAAVADAEDGPIALVPKAVNHCLLRHAFSENIK